MKTKYRGFELEVKREKCLGGWSQVYYTAYLDGYELICSHSEHQTPIRELMADFKCTIDDIIEDEEVREMFIDEEDWEEIKGKIKR
jgi:hypothetical protein